MPGVIRFMFNDNSFYNKFFISCLVFTFLNPFARSFNDAFYIVFVIIGILVPVYFLFRGFKEDDRELDEFIKNIRENESNGDRDD